MRHGRAAPHDVLGLLVTDVVCSAGRYAEGEAMSDCIYVVVTAEPDSEFKGAFDTQEEAEAWMKTKPSTTPRYSEDLFIIPVLWNPTDAPFEEWTNENRL